MTLFLNTGSSVNWCGYDFVVGRLPADADSVSVEKRTENGWQQIGSAKYQLKGNQIQIEIPLSLIGLENTKTVDIKFKWADNYQGEDDIYSFYLHGDAAPYGRQNYSFTAEKPAFEPLKMMLQEIRTYGVPICDSRQESAVAITGYTIEGGWEKDRIDVYQCNPELSYDGDLNTKWNPQAKNFKSGEAIIYTLAHPCDLTQLQLHFKSRQQYFTVYVSSDGVDYTPIAEITASNASRYYSQYVCTVDDLMAQNVKYIKLSFTGRSDTSLWINFHEIIVTGKF